MARKTKTKSISTDQVWARMVSALGKVSKERLTPSAAPNAIFDARDKLTPRAVRVLAAEFHPHRLRLNGTAISPPRNLNQIHKTIVGKLSDSDTLVFTARQPRATANLVVADKYRSDEEIWNALTRKLSPDSPEDVGPKELLSAYVTGGPGVVDAWFVRLCRFSIFGEDGLYLTSASVKGKKTIEKIADAISDWYASH